jgi:hypothetical protein
VDVTLIDLPFHREILSNGLVMLICAVACLQSYRLVRAIGWIALWIAFASNPLLMPAILGWLILELSYSLIQALRAPEPSQRTPPP